MTSTAYQNIYVYAASTLWLAYGLAILATAFAVGIGIIALALSGAAFSSNFSTIFRISRTARISEEVTAAESDGRQPLPERLAKARVVFSSTRGKLLETTSSPGLKTDIEKSQHTAKTSLLSEDGEYQGQDGQPLNSHQR